MKSRVRRHQVGNNVSHSNKKSKRRFNPNLKTKRFWNEEEGRWITLKVTAHGWQNITKKVWQRSQEAAAPKSLY